MKFYPLVISSFVRILFTDLKSVFYLSSVYGWFNFNSPNFEMVFEGTLIEPIWYLEQSELVLKTNAILK